MAKSRLTFQIDECFVKAVRNESKDRRKRFREDKYEHVQDFYREFKRLGLISDPEDPEIHMKKKVIRTLIRE
ncbi:MAG: hypothetical protein ACMUHY_03320 [Thermoplasmatota archaeon]